MSNDTNNDYLNRPSSQSSMEIPRNGAQEDSQPSPPSLSSTELPGRAGRGGFQRITTPLSEAFKGAMCGSYVFGNAPLEDHFFLVKGSSDGAWNSRDAWFLKTMEQFSGSTTCVAAVPKRMRNSTKPPPAQPSTSTDLKTNIKSERKMKPPSNHVSIGLSSNIEVYEEGSPFDGPPPDVHGACAKYFHRTSQNHHLRRTSQGWSIPQDGG